MQVPPPGQNPAQWAAWFAPLVGMRLEHPFRTVHLPPPLHNLDTRLYFLQRLVPFLLPGQQHGQERVLLQIGLELEFPENQQPRLHQVERIATIIEWWVWIMRHTPDEIGGWWDPEAGPQGAPQGGGHMLITFHVLVRWAGPNGEPQERVLPVEEYFHWPTHANVFGRAQIMTDNVRQNIIRNLFPGAYEVEWEASVESSTCMVITNYDSMRAIRRLPHAANRHAGCGSRTEDREYLPLVRNGDTQAFFEVINPRCPADSNNCVLAACMYGYKVFQGKPFRKTCKVMRREMGLSTREKLRLSDLPIVAEYFQMGIRAWAGDGPEAGAVICDCRGNVPGQYPFFVDLLLRHEHAYFLKQCVGKCTFCEMPIRPGHLNDDGLCCMAPCPYCHIKHRHVDLCPQNPEILAMRDNDAQIRRTRLIERKMPRSFSSDPEETAKMTEQMRDILSAIEQHQSVLVLGQAGTGKTFITIHQLLEKVHDWNETKDSDDLNRTIHPLVCAPTGQAASLIPGARTIHSLFHMLPKDTSWITILNRWKKLGIKHDDMAALRRMNMLIIDECSMLTGSMLDMMDQLLRQWRKVTDPENEYLAFGGVQCIFVGDFLQLPPVDADKAAASTPFEDGEDAKHTEERGYLDFCFDSQVLRYMMQKEMKIYYLTHPFRYDDESYFRFLSEIRRGAMSRESWNKLQSRVIADETALHSLRQNATLLTPWNRSRQKWNDERIQDILRRDQVAHRQARTYTAQDSGRARDLEAKAAYSLTLCPGVKVMLLSNRWLRDQGIANGSTGIVRRCEPDACYVYFHQIEKVVEITRIKIASEKDPSVKRFQLPLTLAHALTIHKAQGMTLDKAIVDLSDHVQVGNYKLAFHLAYVAFSRVKNWDSLHLLKPPGINVLHHVNKRCRDFMEVCESIDQATANTYALDVHGETWDIRATPTPEETIEPVNTTYMSVLQTKVKAKWGRSDRNKNRREGAYRWKVQQRSIFFDVETCWQSPTDKRLQMYKIVAKKIEFGKVEDLEWTKTSPEQNLMEEFGNWVFALLETWRTQFEQAQTAQEEACAKIPWRLCAFNGANFDFHFFLQYLFHRPEMMEHWEMHHLFRAATIVQFDLALRAKRFAVGLVVHDLGRFLTGMSLDRACKSFLGLKIKGHFPHQALNRVEEGWRLVLPDCGPITILRQDFFGRDQEVLDQLKTPGDREAWTREFMGGAHGTAFGTWNEETGRFVCFEHVNLHVILEKYVRQDVEAMFQLYLKMDELVLSCIHASIMDFYSANQLALYGLLTNLPHEAKYNPGNKHEIITKLHRWAHDQDRFGSQAIYGGRVLPRIRYFQSQGTDDALVMADITSMYVSVMMRETFPLGQCTWMDAVQCRAILHKCQEKDLEWIRQHWFIVEVDCMPHPMELEPPIANRTESGRISWDNYRRVGVYCNIDIYLLLRNHGQVFEIKRGMQWAKSAPIFEKWMKKTLVWKEQGQRTKNIGLRSFGKLCGNSTYGGFAMRTPRNIVKLCLHAEDVDHFFNKAEWESTFLTKKGWIMYGKLKDWLSCESKSAKYLAVYVLAYSRLMLDDFVTQLCPNRRAQAGLYEQPYYGDTDSLIFHVRQLDNVRALLGDEPGLWNDDLGDDWQTKGFAKIWEYVGAAPKIYAIRYTLPGHEEERDTQPKEKVRCKGIRMDVPILYNNHEYVGGINFEILKRAFQENPHARGQIQWLVPMLRQEDFPSSTYSSIRKVGYRLLLTERMQEENAPFQLEAVEQNRSLFRSIWKGRQPLDFNSHLTLPLGYKENSEDDGEEEK